MPRASIIGFKGNEWFIFDEKSRHFVVSWVGSAYGRATTFSELGEGR